MRVIFAGTPDFACPCLRALAESAHEVVAVLTQPDRGQGRGRKVRASPVKELAQSLNIAVHQPTTLRDSAAVSLLRGMQADLMVVVAYGQILPREVLEIPVHGCINVHASLLPRWRGAAPIQRAILAGDRESGLTIMQMNEELDTGDILLRRRCAITPETTGGELHDRLAGMGGAALTHALRGLQEGTLTPVAQDNAAACYAGKLHKSEARMDWQQPAAALERRIRAFNPWPVCTTGIADKTVRIWAAVVRPHVSGTTPGRVLDAGADGVDVATGDGVLRILELQWPGKRRISAGEAANGRDLQGLVLH